MNICIFGNQDNVGYRFCMWLRDAGHNAHLYMMTHWESIRSKPEAVDKHLEGQSYPDWIHVYNNSIPNTFFGDRQCIREIQQQFDVVVAIGSMAMMHAYRFDRLPLVNISTGPSNQGVIKMWEHLGLKYFVFWKIVRFFVRKSVRRCQKIIVGYDPELYSLKKLRQLGKAIFYAMPEDVAGNRGRVDAKLLHDLDNRYKQYSKVFLWLGRIAFSDPHSAMYKGTDKFIEAAARVMADGANVRLIIGKHGEDYKKLVELVRQRNLSGHVDWVEHMPFWELLTYLSIDNAVTFDELTTLHCTSSGMFRECLSVGGILVRSYSAVLTRAGHGAEDCPVLHAESVEEVRQRMEEVLSWTSEATGEWKRRVADWSARNLDRRHQIRRLVTILEEAVYSYRTAERLSLWYE